MLNRIQFGDLIFNQHVSTTTQQAFQENSRLKTLVAQFEEAKKDVLVLGHTASGTFQSIFVAPKKEDHQTLIQNFEHEPAIIAMEYEFKEGTFKDINYIGHTLDEEDNSLPTQINRSVEHLTAFKSAITNTLENLKGYSTASAFLK